MTADTLKDNTAPLQLPAANTPNTGIDALGGVIGQQTDTFLADQTAKAEAAKTAKDNSLEAFLKGKLNTPGEAQLTDKTYKDTVDPAEADLKDINQQIIEEQHGLQRSLEALDANPHGLMADALDQEKQKVKNTSIKKQADLSIIQLARQGKYDSAKQIADRAIAAELEVDKTNLETLQTIYEDNKDEFNTEDQRAFESAQTARQFALENKEYRLRAQYDQTIRQNDPLYRAQLAKATQDLNTGSVTITNPAAGAYSTALSVILGSGKFTKDQKADVIAGINSGQDPLTVVKNQAKNIMGQTEATKLTSYETAQSALNDIGKQLSQFYAAGGNTGLLAGNFESVVNKLGQVNDPKLVNLATQIQGNLQVYRNAISGTAYSAQEGKDIRSIFPGIDKSQGLNTAIVKARNTLFNSVIDGTYRSAIGPSYDEIKSIDTAGTKGKLTDAQFVEKALTDIGAKYDEVIAKVPPGQKAVVDNRTGQVGYVSQSEYDSSLYTSL